VTSRALSGTWPTPAPTVALDLRVEGPEIHGLTDGDIRRLFPGRTTGDRLNRLRNWPRIVVRVEHVPVGVATYTQTPLETHVPEFAVDIPASLEGDYGSLRSQVSNALLDAIEIASLAGGCRRIVVIPAGRIGDFTRRGYVSVSEGCGGSWMEKTLL
jgi:hypothetical protein